VVDPTSPSKSKAQIQFENQKLHELMSHLLYLNSCDNYPNKCPHICLHLIVKQHPAPPGPGNPVRGCLNRDAYYTDHHHHGNHKIENSVIYFLSNTAQRLFKSPSLRKPSSTIITTRHPPIGGGRTIRTPSKQSNTCKENYGVMLASL
jgi:hypothetical protein